VSKEEWHMMWQSLIDGKDAAFDWQNKYKDFMFLLMDSSGGGLSSLFGESQT
jgi:hypothetical protein